jgi:hypothetical protein
VIKSLKLNIASCLHSLLKQSQRNKEQVDFAPPPLQFFRPSTGSAVKCLEKYLLIKKCEVENQIFECFSSHVNQLLKMPYAHLKNANFLCKEKLIRVNNWIHWYGEINLILFHYAVGHFLKNKLGYVGYVWHNETKIVLNSNMMIPDFSHNIRIRLARLKFFCSLLTLPSLCPVGCLSLTFLNWDRQQGRDRATSGRNNFFS